MRSVHNVQLMLIETAEYRFLLLINVLVQQDLLKLRRFIINVIPAIFLVCSVSLLTMKQAVKPVRLIQHFFALICHPLIKNALAIHQMDTLTIKNQFVGNVITHVKAARDLPAMTVSHVGLAKIETICLLPLFNPAHVAKGFGIREQIKFVYPVIFPARNAV